MNELFETLTISEEPEIPLKSGEQDTSIRFVEKHFLDIKNVLELTRLDTDSN